MSQIGSDRATRWLTAIAALADHALRVQRARMELDEYAPEELAEALDEICLRSERGERVAREVLLAFVPVLVDPGHLTRVGLVRAAAEERSLGAAGRLLRESTVQGSRSPTGSRGEEEAQAAEANASLRHPDGRPLTLGERRARARAPGRGVLRQLLRDPHPMVVELLLANPRLTEEDVVDMAARRPAVPSALAQIARTWTRHARVRRAVVLNPGCPPAVSVPLLSLLSRPELRATADAMDVPAVVRRAAHELAERRPPREELGDHDLLLGGGEVNSSR